MAIPSDDLIFGVLRGINWSGGHHLEELDVGEVCAGCVYEVLCEVEEMQPPTAVEQAVIAAVRRALVDPSYDAVEEALKTELPRLRGEHE
jgi:hypothetical protein